ncbi:cryptochrome/photolyase family protein [Pararhizobium antarcticum]|uniref:Deoxyribodipyrimidine photolyase n=1 Tax=Pararhizobium antarcticum TaxID=1798805 RepID=A0A657LT77_9HYPH|nr:cryptochrome/photolyase family protein [Pararhizobium antarcticum]OJF94369.1 deoxyribodipyrimidine photolyase [Rhizobium sp. 58]OJF96910.1 deoxyribodipyrimidine photolyase [Pararhizobium antarcticum]
MVTGARLIFILGDQLSPSISSLKDASPGRDVILLCEVADETRYVRHHKKKIAFLFSAMRHFAEEMRQAGFQVDYIRLDDPANTGSFTGELERAAARHAVERVCVTEPGEWRVAEMMKGWAARLGIPVEIREDTRFLCSRAAFSAWAEGRKQMRMEYFYRDMRRKSGLLMRGDAPEGGRWNYDADNRKPAVPDLFAEGHAGFSPDATTGRVLELVAARFADHFGSLEDFRFAVTRADAEMALDHFIEHHLALFGDYQDAMLSADPFLHHSLLSAYINVGLLDPLVVCRRVERAYLEGKAPLNCVEGFIRQIIGWREYVRGVYWLKMPDYAQANFFENDRPLPDFYWTAETDLNCLKTVISETRDNAYAHHIQRLMITGNFAMLAGVRPADIHRWYLEVYVDAFEWVELPNVIGMSQFADGGFLGSKPYAAGGNYIGRMSDYCETCRYDVKKKTGEGACPFNALYWDFLDRNAQRLRGNPRLGPVYSTWDRMGGAQKEDTRASAARFLAGIDALPRTYGQ